MPDDGRDIVRSAGDDCLAVETPAGGRLLLTVDTFVDGVHFTPEYSTWNEIGARCAAASVSDIAAMSGVPLWSLVSLSMPRTLLLEDALDLFRGIADTAASYGCPVAGGETTSTPGPATVTVTVIGRVEPERMILRSGARPGDGVFASGRLGDAMAGLEALRRGIPGFDRLKRAFLLPEAKTALSRELTARHRVSAMIDLSDGLASDLGHICEESGCGAEVHDEVLPLSEEYLLLMERFDLDPVAFAVTGGEDYGLLFTSPDPGLAAAGEIAGERITRIGTITTRAGVIERVRPDGSVLPVTVKGYEHFKT